MSMPDPALAPPVLSICIPTYNRAPYLDFLLKEALETWNFSFPYEIVISDNASPDDTSEVVRRYIDRGLPIRYFRQAVNKGGAPNNMTALHRAVGAYIMYLADDDLLDVEGIEAAIAQLRNRSDLQALYAPWQYFDAVKNEKIGQFFYIQDDVTFGSGQHVGLFEFIIKHHIFPEHMIYRADTLRIILLDPPFCYWAFVYLAHVSARGSVHFSKTPFYRSIVSHPGGLNRAQLGTEQAMTDWDTYRGGLEYFVYVLQKRQGLVFNEEHRRQVRILIDAFIADRMRVALRLWVQRNDYISAYNLIVRLHHLDPAETAQIPDVARIQLLAANQILARFTNAIASVDRLVILGEADIVQKRLQLVALGLRDDIALGTDVQTLDPATLHGSVVVIQREEDRPNVLALGYGPGLVISEDDIFAGLHLI